MGSRQRQQNAESAGLEHLDWDAAKLTEPLPPYDWGPHGEPEGDPVIYGQGIGFIVLDKESEIRNPTSPQTLRPLDP